MEGLNLKWYEKFTFFVVTKTEDFYFKLGHLIASNPWKTILCCLLAVFIGLLGLVRFHHEKNPMNLWVPPSSDFFINTELLMNKYQTGIRTQMVLIKAKNVLAPNVIKEVFKINQEITNTASSSGIKFKDVCFRIPELDAGMEFFLSKERQRNNNSEEGLDLGLSLADNTYCKIFNTLDEECFQKSILGLWYHKPKLIQKLTQDDILNAVNTNYKKFVGPEKTYADLLGGIVRNSSGHIIGASTIVSMWMLHVNFSAINMDETGNLVGTSDWASVESLLWEEAFILKMENLRDLYRNSNLIDIFYSSSRSFGDISKESMFQEIDLLIIGAIVMGIYIQFVISKFNWVEARVILGHLGLLSVGIAYLLACGVCSLIGISYGPIHASLPFLLMGLGVDDMFIIMTCWHKISNEERKLPLADQIGLMMKHAGVSITVTSLTDVTAFLIGSTTILPCLRSFCLYTAVGVLLTFIFVVTFFTACFVLDQQRVEQNRNGAIPCIIHHKVNENHFSQRQYSNKVFDFIYSKIILTPLGKVVVIAISLICTGFSIESTLKLEQKFDQNWFISENTYLAQFNREQSVYYPSMGYEGGIYVGEINYPKEVTKIQTVIDKLKNLPGIVNGVNSWVRPFQTYVKKNFKKDIFSETLSNVDWNNYLSKFLFSPSGGHFQANFKFSEQIKCGSPTGNITMSQIEFRYNNFKGPTAWIPAMFTVKNITKSANFSTGDKLAFSWAKIYGNWETDVVIKQEVIRNLQLALLCVMFCTLLLIANIQICFWIFACILLTMINILGFMQRWGLTVDLVTSIGLQLSVGLCVDYATHIGHTFLTTKNEDLNQRVIYTVSSIGSAVLYGGLSTLIGIAALSFSSAYTFQTFFKIFLLVVLFGLFHGIVLLPVILSLIGPLPYRKYRIVHSNNTNIPNQTLELKNIPFS